MIGARYIFTTPKIQTNSLLISIFVRGLCIVFKHELEESLILIIKDSCQNHYQYFNGPVILQFYLYLFKIFLRKYLCKIYAVVLFTRAGDFTIHLANYYHYRRLHSKLVHHIYWPLDIFKWESLCVRKPLQLFWAMYKWC